MLMSSGWRISSQVGFRRWGDAKANFSRPVWFRYSTFRISLFFKSRFSLVTPLGLLGWFAMIKMLVLTGTSCLYEAAKSSWEIGSLWLPTSPYLFFIPFQVHKQTWKKVQYIRLAMVLPRSNDVLIAVLGETGVGKTTFICKATGKNLPIGHGVLSCELN
jgi:hypothetical protein